MPILKTLLRRLGLSLLAEDARAVRTVQIYSALDVGEAVIRAQGYTPPLRDQMLATLGVMVAIGNIGLMTAVERYDPELGYRFSTYATFWIRQAIGRAVANLSRTIRVPVHMHDLISKVRRTEAQLEQQLGRPATDAEVAKQLDLEVERVEQARTAIPRTSSLDKPIGEDGESTIGDLLPDPASDQVVEEAVSSAIRDQIRKSLDQLTERERGVLMLRFGLAGQQPQTLAEIADHYGISRERVRQIEKEALAKLRKSDLIELASAA